MDNMNFDQNTMNNIKKMVDNGNLSGAMSQISPEMLQSFSKMLSNNQGSNNSSNVKGNESNTFASNSNNVNNNYVHNSSSQSNSPSNLGDIDMATVMRLSSALNQVKNSNNDPRANLLNSLKPYLKDENKEKVDEYMKLLNITKIAEIMNENNKNIKSNNPNMNNKNNRRF